MKKATRYFLTRADFSKGPVALEIEINLERFLIRPDIHLSFHNFQDVGIYWLLNRRVRRTNYGATVILSRSEGRRILRLFVQRQSNCEVPGIRGMTDCDGGNYNRTLSTAFAAIQPR